MSTAMTAREAGAADIDTRVAAYDWTRIPEHLDAHGRAPHMKVWREYSSQMKTAPTVIEIISDGKVEKL